MTDDGSRSRTFSLFSAVFCCFLPERPEEHGVFSGFEQKKSENSQIQLNLGSLVG